MWPWLVVIGAGYLVYRYAASHEEEATIDDLLESEPGGEAEAPQAPGTIATGYTMATWIPHVQEAAVMYDLDPALVQGFILKESSGNPRAVNPRERPRDRTHVGLMQIKCQTAKTIGFTGRCPDLFDPKINIMYGSAYLRYLLDQVSEDVPLALASYFVGPNSRRLARDTMGKFQDRKVDRYVQRVLELADQFKTPGVRA